ncbi:cation:proton antiporter [Leptolyngbya sp. AN02str]|uniref:cation:proton antiporter n=1 Tax=Leptolyngbya sp. AN02str TaxID=3423363 RepID=UPI003D320CDA
MVGINGDRPYLTRIWVPWQLYHFLETMLDGLTIASDTPLATTLQFVIAVIAGISAQVLADFCKVPSIVFLLAFGILLGADGADVLQPQQLGSGLEVIVTLSVALILFEGGLNLELRNLKQVSGSLRNLVTIGTLITLVGGGMAAHWLGEFPWAIAFLYAALVVVTGPTVISPLLKQVQVDTRVATLLEGEGVLIDPVGAILAVVVLDVILNGDADPLLVVSGLFLRLSIGGGIGALGGWVLSYFLKRTRFLSEDLKNLVVLAGVWGLFVLAQAIRDEAGLMSAVIAGLVLRSSSIPDERLLRRFKGQLTIFAVSVLFVLLAADLSLASLFALGQGAVFTVAVLMFVVRPINVAVCTYNSDLNWRQKLFICWVAPRGIVSASVASLFAILLTDRGISGGEAIKALVFLTIISTVFLQGLTARWIAQLLGITSDEATGVVIAGSNPLSRLLAQVFIDKGEPATLIDTDLQACRKAELEGLPAFASTALDAEVLTQAGMSQRGTFLAMTNNGEVNLVLAQKAVEEFNPPRVAVMVTKDSAGAIPAESAVNAGKVKSAFLPLVPLKAWNRFINDREVRLGETFFQTDKLPRQIAHVRILIEDEKVMPLLLEREEKLLIASASDEWRDGDRLIYLYHAPKTKLLKQLGGANSQARLIVERIPEVENLPDLDFEPTLDSKPDSKPDAKPDLKPELPTKPKLEAIQPTDAIAQPEQVIEP